MSGRNNFPKLHNAMWPGLVGKGRDSEPPIGLDEMLEITAAAEVTASLSSRRQARRRARRRVLAARHQRQADPRDSSGLLARLHVRRQRNEAAANLERCA